jgi:hemoglobin
MEYTGKNMKDAHKGRGITNPDFDKVCGHVVSTMQELGVPEDLIQEVSDLLNTVRHDTVTA